MAKTNYTLAGAMNTELLQIDPSFQWASIFLFSLMAAVSAWIVRALVLSRNVFPNASRLDWGMTSVVLTFFIAGMSAWTLHPLFPSRPWRWLVLRDLSQRLGPFLGFEAMIVLAFIRLGFDSTRRHELLLRARLLGWKAWVAFPLILGVVGWNSWKGGLDVADMFATPIAVRDLAAGFRRGYRSLPADAVFAKSGRLVIPHGMRLLEFRKQEYEIELTPHGRILLSCRQ